MNRRDFVFNLSSYFLLGNQKANEFSEETYLKFKIDSTNSHALESECLNLEKKLHSQVSAIVDFFGKNNINSNISQTIKIKILDDCVSGFYFENKNPVIDFSLARLRKNNCPVAHELFHALYRTRPVGFGSVLSEGAAIYAQRKVGFNFAFPDFGKDSYSLAKEASETMYAHRVIPDIWFAIKTLESEKSLQTFDERYLSYLISDLFVSFLIEEQFKNKIGDFMEVYFKVKSIPTWNEVVGVDFSKMENDWNAYLRKKD